MASKVRDNDRGGKLLTRRLRDLDRRGGLKLTMGVHDDIGRQPHPSGRPIGAVAHFIEFGARGTAPVSYVRATFDQNRAGLARELADAGREFIRGKVTLRDAYGGVIGRIVRQMKARVPVETGTTRNAVEGRIDGEAV